MIQSCVIIGAGNVGSHIAVALQQQSISVVQMYSRSAEKIARAKAANLANFYIQNITDLLTDADLYIIAVKDDAIVEIAGQLPKSIKGIVCHTSGSVNSTVLNAFKSFGVFYPLQTFTWGKVVNMQTVPFCITGNNERVKTNLYQLATRLSKQVQYINDQQRASLHVAAVFVNNFTNHLLSIAEDICIEQGVAFDLLRPLLREGIEKVAHNSPADIQTGPAIRLDKKTMNNHYKLLSYNIVYKNLYKTISDSIVAFHNE